MGALSIADFTRSRHQLSYVFAFDRLRFSTTIWYETVDFDELEARYGADFLQWLYFHIGAFEINKVCSLKPATIDFGPFAPLVTDTFAVLWKAIFRGVWAQWRYENGEPDYLGPEITLANGDHIPTAASISPDDGPDVLAFCGGGKDSLVALRLLDEVGVPYSTLAYSSSIYGRAEPQHALIDGLLDQCAPVTRHRQWVYEDFMDSPVLELDGEIDAQTLTAAETPSSIFEALPYALQHGYRYLCLAHEHSADRGNLVWDATGEEVNHQWGKSTAAELLINDYLGKHLITNLEYFSILKPIHDVLIFGLLAEHVDAVPFTHSCNVAKPWCKRCPKCAYVWINYMAHLPVDVVDAMFGENLLDLPENRRWFRQMLGLEEHTPFECIGEIPEARLAFELAHRKGVTGQAMDDYLAAVDDTDVAAIADRYLAVDHEYVISHPAADAIFAALDAAAQRTHDRVTA